MWVPLLLRQSVPPPTRLPETFESLALLALGYFIFNYGPKIIEAGIGLINAITNRRLAETASVVKLRADLNAAEGRIDTLEGTIRELREQFSNAMITKNEEIALQRLRIAQLEGLCKDNGIQI